MGNLKRPKKRAAQPGLTSMTTAMSISATKASITDTGVPWLRTTPAAMYV